MIRAMARKRVADTISPSLAGAHLYNSAALSSSTANRSVRW
jgi:hypothetical protein